MRKNALKATDNKYTKAGLAGEKIELNNNRKNVQFNKRKVKLRDSDGDDKHLAFLDQNVLSSFSRTHQMHIRFGVSDSRI